MGQILRENSFSENLSDSIRIFYADFKYHVRFSSRETFYVENFKILDYFLSILPLEWKNGFSLQE